MKPHILMDLTAPMMSFGAEQVGEIGPTGCFPATSMITGIIANALGWTRTEPERHDRLQGRIVMGAAAVRPGRVMTDFQTAHLDQKDAGWTTRGGPEGRSVSSTTFVTDVDHLRRTGEVQKRMTHRRWRDYVAGGRYIVALRLEPSEEEPTLDQVADALRRPARPLFIGRRPFIPSTRMLMGIVEARTVRGALWEALIDVSDDPGAVRAQWDEDEGGDGMKSRMNHLRSWTSGVHAGERRVIEGVLS